MQNLSGDLTGCIQNELGFIAIDRIKLVDQEFHDRLQICRGSYG